MANISWILFLELDGCWVYQVPPGQAAPAMTHFINNDPAASHIRWGESVVDHLKSQGYAGEPVLLGIESDQCLAISMPLTPNSPRNHRTLSYALEVNLPLAAEDFVADFIFHSDAALAVALATVAVQPFVETLEDGGVVVQAITPTAMLAVQVLLSESGRDSGPVIVLWRFQEHVELFEMDRSAGIRRWQHLPNDVAAVLRHLQHACLRYPTPPRAVACDFDSEVLAALSQQYPAAIEAQADCSLLDSAARTGADLLAHRRTPRIELRRGALAGRDKYRSVRGLLRFTQLAAAVFLLVTIGVSTIRTHQYNHLASKVQASQQALFHTVLPGQRMVTGMKSRLDSEYKKLSAVANVQSASPDTVSALDTLSRLLRSLPDELALRLQEIRLQEAGYVYLRGQVSSHGGADALATALRAGEFNVQQPTSTQVSDQVVTLSLAATAEPTEKSRLEGSL